MVLSLNGKLTLIAFTAVLSTVAAGSLSKLDAADVTLSWSDNSSNENGFEIQRKIGTSGTFIQRAIVGVNVTSYVDTGLAAATTFCYRVRAFNSAGNSAFTPEGCKTTPSGTTTFNYSLAHGGNKSVTRGQSVSNVITATLTSGSSQSVSFLTSGLPTGATATYAASNSCNPTCSRTLNITTASSTPTGTFPISVTGTGGSVAKTATFNLTVTSPSGTSTFDFSLVHSGNKSVTRGQSVSNVITATLTSGSSQSVTFSTSGLPTGVTPSYATSSSCTPTCSRTLNITTLSSTPTGTFPITVTGTGGGVAKTATFNLAVTSPASVSSFILEAEKGILTAPMAVRSDILASQGKYVAVPAGTGNNLNDATKGGPGEVRFAINIPQAVTYALWARTIASNDESNSFYVTRNGTLVKEWDVPASTSWKWNKVANLSLASGNVNIAFRQREAGTKVDLIVLTSDLSIIPGESTPTLATVAFSGSYDLSVSVVKTLTKSGSGNGAVTSSPIGINCGTDCSQTYSNGAVVKLIATPDSGSVFGGWSGNAACNNGAITMNADIACTATFSPQTLGLNVIKSGNGSGTVISSPSGITCGSDCSESYASGASVKLTATVASGSIFRGWSGGGCNKAITCTVVVNGSTSVTALFDTAESITAKIGVYRPSTGDFLLDRNGNGRWDGCSVDICLNWLAQSGGLPVVGNWDGGDTTQIGTFTAANGKWYLDRNGNGRWDGCAVDVCITSFGKSGDIPIVSYPKDSEEPVIGIFRSAVITKVNGQNTVTDRGIWQFDTNKNGVHDGCGVDYCVSKFGHPGDLAVAGDWDGSGEHKMGVFEADGATWRLDYNGNGVMDGCNVDRCLSSFGRAGDLPVAGDWDGTGKARVGVFRPSTGEWFLDKNGNGRIDGCTADICVAAFGKAGDRPVVGKW